MSLSFTPLLFATCRCCHDTAIVLAVHTLLPIDAADTLTPLLLMLTLFSPRDAAAAFIAIDAAIIFRCPVSLMLLMPLLIYIIITCLRLITIIDATPRSYAAAAVKIRWLILCWHYMPIVTPSLLRSAAATPPFSPDAMLASRREADYSAIIDAQPRLRPPAAIFSAISYADTRHARLIR